MPPLRYQNGGCPLDIAGGRAGSAAFTGRPGRTAAGAEKERKKVPMMSDVACFCGCCFSFDGAAGACPTCGEVARVTAGPAPGSAGRSRPEHPVPVMDGAGRNGKRRGPARDGPTPAPVPCPASRSARSQVIPGPPRCGGGSHAGVRDRGIFRTRRGVRLQAGRRWLGPGHHGPPWRAAGRPGRAAGRQARGERADPRRGPDRPLRRRRPGAHHHRRPA